MDYSLTHGDKTAWDRFYRVHYSWLLRLIEIRSGNQFLAQDITHDTFIKVMYDSRTHLLKDDVTNYPRAFLRTVANNILIDNIRHSLVEESYLNYLEMCTVEQVNPQQHIETIEELSKLSQVLETYNEVEQRSFLLYYIDGLNHREIASNLAVSISTVRRAIANCMMGCYDAFC